MSENRRNASDVFASGASLYHAQAVEVLATRWLIRILMEKRRLFQFYPNDFLLDANVISQSMQERGVYITLLCVCWQQGLLLVGCKASRDSAGCRSRRFGSSGQLSNCAFK